MRQKMCHCHLLFRTKSTKLFPSFFADLYYRQKIHLDGQVVELEIVDVSEQPEVRLDLVPNQTNQHKAITFLYIMEQ